MDSHNLAVVIAPTLLRRRQDPHEKFANQDDAKNLAHQYSLINSIISKADWFFSTSNNEPPPVSPKSGKSPAVERPNISELFYPTNINTTTNTISDSGSENGSSKLSKKKGFFNFKRNSRENLAADNTHTFITSCKWIQFIIQHFFTYGFK
jgi:hypothetical protein